MYGYSLMMKSPYRMPDIFCDDDEWVCCERCCKEIRRSKAYFGYQEHSDEPYCKDCYNWFELECDRTGQENIFFRP